MHSRWRRISAFHLAAFFIAIAAAPHHHLDPIADLVSDGPSNSGRFSLIVGPVDRDLGIYPSCLVDDESCLACFNHDFVASPASQIVLTPILTLLDQDRHQPSQPAPSLIPADTPSRAPPIAA